MVDRLQRSDEEATQRVDVALAYLDLLSNPHAFYLATDERLKRMVVDAMWPSFHIDDEEGGVVAPGELHEPVARLERAAAEYKADKLKSASQSADALDESPSDLYLQVVCSNSAVVVGLVQWYSKYSGRTAHLRRLAAQSGVRKPEAPVALKQAKRLDAAAIAAFTEAYRKGANVREQARALGVHRSTLHELVRRQGLVRLPTRTTPEQRLLAAAYEQGATLSELAERHSMGPNRIARQLRAAGIKLRPRGRRSES